MVKVVKILEDLLKHKHNEVLDWFEQAYKGKLPCFYSSVDLRYSGHKLAPVDTNLFPAGFNNLSQEGQELSSRQADKFLNNNFRAHKVLIIAEYYNRNLHYLDNIVTLKSIIENTNRVVELAIIAEDHTNTKDIELTSASKGDLKFSVVEKNKEGYLVTSTGFVADIIILNNDLTRLLPEVLRNIKQPVIPSVHLGWYRRRKSHHFYYYNQLLQQFSEEFDIDSFLFSTVFNVCDQLDFKRKNSLERLAEKVDALLSIIHAKYNKYNIKEEPYVFIKSDSGTYGRGIISVKSAKEILEMNKKYRNSMHIIKGGVQNSQVIIQEGIRTIHHIENNVAEPLVYLVNNVPVECIFRVNKEHNELENLNSSGMYFVNNSNLKYKDAFYLIAKLANLAAIYEANEYQLNQSEGEDDV